MTNNTALKAINEEFQESKASTLAENLQALLESHNLGINQLAQILGIPMMTIRRLASGETIDPRISTLKLIAEYFDISIDVLIGDDTQASLSSIKKSKPYFVPILDWDTVEKIGTINELDLSNWKVWQSISLNENNTIGKNAFGLESRPSMYPRFPQGTIFIIDPDINPTDGDMVLVRIKKNNELTLRNLVVDPPEWLLHPIVPGASILDYSEENHKIVGVNLLTLLYNRKIYD